MALYFIRPLNLSDIICSSTLPLSHFKCIIHSSLFSIPMYTSFITPALQIHDWTAYWYLKLNRSKTQFIIFLATFFSASTLPSFPVLTSLFCKYLVILLFNTVCLNLSPNGVWYILLKCYFLNTLNQTGPHLTPFHPDLHYPHYLFLTLQHNQVPEVHVTFYQIIL